MDTKKGLVGGSFPRTSPIAPEGTEEGQGTGVDIRWNSHLLGKARGCPLRHTPVVSCVVTCAGREREARERVGWGSEEGILGGAGGRDGAGMH